MGFLLGCYIRCQYVIASDPDVWSQSLPGPITCSWVPSRPRGTSAEYCALILAIWFSLAQPTLQPGMATMIGGGGGYRAIPPLSMGPQLISIAAAIWVLIQRSNR